MKDLGPMWNNPSFFINILIRKMHMELNIHSFNILVEQFQGNKQKLNFLNINDTNT